MKKPKLSELTLREKIGQTMIRGGKAYLKHDDYKEYYKNNNLGVLWSCFENREDFERVCNDMGKTVKGLYGELEFTDYNPFPLNPITKTNDIDFIRVM